MTAAELEALAAETLTRLRDGVSLQQRHATTCNTTGGGPTESCNEPCNTPSPVELAGWTLSRFGRSKLACLVRSALLQEDVVFAGDGAVIPEAWERLPVYRGRELITLVTASPEDVRTIHRAKKQFGGTVDSVISEEKTS